MPMETAAATAATTVAEPANKQPEQLATKAMKQDSLDHLPKACDHLQKAMDHDDATAATTFHAKRAQTHVKAVHDAHAEPAEDKAELTSEHLDRLKKAMGYCSKGMEHKEATEEVAKCFKDAHGCIGKCLKGMGKEAEEASDDESDEGEKAATVPAVPTAPAAKSGRAISAANEKKLNKAKSRLKSIADDDDAHDMVRKSASAGVESIDGIFARDGGDSGTDYDEEGNYTGADIGAYIDGEPNKGADVKAGKVLSAKNRELVQKAAAHAQAIVDHDQADDWHKANAKAALKQFNDVMGEGAGDDGPAMGTDPSTAEPGQGKSAPEATPQTVPEKSLGDRASELADEFRFAVAEGDKEKLFDLIEAAGAVDSLINSVKEAQLDVDLALAETQLDRELDRALDAAESLAT